MNWDKDDRLQRARAADRIPKPHREGVVHWIPNRHYGGWDCYRDPCPGYAGGLPLQRWTVVDCEAGTASTHYHLGAYLLPDPEMRPDDTGWDVVGSTPIAMHDDHWPVLVLVDEQLYDRENFPGDWVQIWEVGAP